MMFATRTIIGGYPLIVGEFYEDAVLASTPDGQVFRIPRFWIETPVLCCAKCGKAALVKRDKFKRIDYAECPDHVRHMYEMCYVAMNDSKQYNREQQRKLHKQANRWLKIWLSVVQSRTGITVGSC